MEREREREEEGEVRDQRGKCYGGGEGGGDWAQSISWGPLLKRRPQRLVLPVSSGRVMLEGMVRSV